MMRATRTSIWLSTGSEMTDPVCVTRAEKALSEIPLEIRHFEDLSGYPFEPMDRASLRVLRHL